MIKFKSVKYKNFLSTGNSYTEINLNRTKSTLVVGQNGAGKSTMLDAISFALFGRPHRNINKPQLINSINQKACVVEVEFSVGSAGFRIVRGIKPGIFEIWKNGTMINQSSHAKEYQKILEQNILKLNHKSFHQVVVLGSSSFIPFMQLSAGHRREVIEDLLDINVFSKMNNILRDKQSILKDQLKDLTYQTDINKNKIDTQNKYIREIQKLTQENRKEYESKIHASQNSISELQRKNSELSLGLQESIVQTEKELSTLHDQRQELLLGSQDRSTNISNLSKRIGFFEENESCPVCDQALADGHKHNILEGLEEERRHHKSSLKEIGKRGTVVEAEISDTGSLLQSLRSRVSELSQNNIQIDSFQKQIQEYQSYLDKNVTADLESAQDDLKSLSDLRNNLLENKFELSENISYNSVIAEMLKDTGIKTKIIKQYLPVINNLVNQYLQVLDFFVHFDLNESFQETIRSRHRDEFTYDSFSEGEKQRIDLALLFTWRQIANMKNSVATNLLILDETFDSSLDHEGVDNLLKILHTLGDDTNIFVISHKGEILDGKFNEKLEFKKEKNFSKMVA
jgi:DNA repair exonuclease SbcCD ATPase subunit